ncbi:MAG: SDR family oxidoreductase [Legionellales bacterium]|nr:SDR family oxidoreductase [Legionellales bacterium]
MNRIKKKIALITGASRGIGAKTAELFAEEGATVIICDILVDEGKELAQTIDGYFYELNVGDEENWEKIREQIYSKFGKLDILFNNAGIIGVNGKIESQDPEHISMESWHHIHEVNLDGVFLGCKYGIELMKRHGGSIINMSSRSGIVGIPEASAYASSKAAIRNHTKTVALYCAKQKYNIRCNSIHPGAILTDLWSPMLGNDDKERQENILNIEAGIPIGKMGESLDVAYAVLYLGSDESKYVTGAELVIDGGILAGSSASPRSKQK